jgi:hypothetical protein
MSYEFVKRLTLWSTSECASSMPTNSHKTRYALNALLPIVFIDIAFDESVLSNILLISCMWVIFEGHIDYAILRCRILQTTIVGRENVYDIVQTAISPVTRGHFNRRGAGDELEPSPHSSAPSAWKACCPIRIAGGDGLAALAHCLLSS